MLVSSVTGLSQIEQTGKRQSVMSRNAGLRESSDCTRNRRPEWGPAEGCVKRLFKVSTRTGAMYVSRRTVPSILRFGLLAVTMGNWYADGQF